MISAESFPRVPKEKMIFAIWHNRLVLALILYRRYIWRRDPQPAAGCDGQRQQGRRDADPGARAL